MAKIEDLISQIADERLKKAISAEVRELKKSKKFGLVFEEHLPETVRLPNLPVKNGELVANKRETGNELWRVKSIHKGMATLERAGNPLPSESGVEAPAADLVVVRSFGDPIYPVLVPIERVARGGPDKPWHMLVNADNFHALQLLLYAYEGKVDVIYIDPPYNTGARDWKYNNDYVDKSDSFRHSKWLSMMNKRLLLAKRLLKSNGVLIVTIDENEVHHLAVLLEQMLPNALRQMVTISINPSGVSGDGLSRVEEHAIFCFCGGARPSRLPDDLFGIQEGPQVAATGWESLLRRGNVWYREKRKNLCYPVLLDPKSHKIAGVGPPFVGDDERKRATSIEGKLAAWPIRRDGRLGIWRVEGKSLIDLAKEGFAYVTNEDHERGTWTIKYLMSGTVSAIRDGKVKIVGYGKHGEARLETTGGAKFIPKTIWRRGAHTAGGAGGSQALTAFLGKRDLFSYPKSVYAVRDCLAVAVLDRPNGVILDFFAGSGTTFHATAILNASDEGSRQSILVTNNEVKEDASKAFAGRNIFPGDDEYERSGLSEAVAWPRCRAVVTGQRPDGKPVEGAHLDGREYSEGFEENIEYCRLDFLDPDEVARGDAFKAIMPILWMVAGCRGEREESKGSTPWFIPKHSPFAVLIQEKQFRAFCAKLVERKDIEWVFLITDSEENFGQMRRALGRKYICLQLYKSYLENFRINTRDALSG
jgi:adenine-specific DNA-methyltransferase